MGDKVASFDDCIAWARLKFQVGGGRRGGLVVGWVGGWFGVSWAVDAQFKPEVEGWVGEGVVCDRRLLESSLSDYAMHSRWPSCAHWLSGLCPSRAPTAIQTQTHTLYQTPHTSSHTAPPPACPPPQDYFHDRIAQLTFTFPEDAVTSTGLPFWSAPKRFPRPVKFDAGDASHTSFVQVRGCMCVCMCMCVWAHAHRVVVLCLCGGEGGAGLPALLLVVKGGLVSAPHAWCSERCISQMDRLQAQPQRIHYVPVTPTPTPSCLTTHTLSTSLPRPAPCPRPPPSSRLRCTASPAPTGPQTQQQWRLPRPRLWCQSSSPSRGSKSRQTPR